MSFQEFCRVLDVERAALAETLKRFETDSEQAQVVERALALLIERSQAGGKVICLGLGKSGKIAAKIAATFSSTGTPALFVHPTEALHGDLGVLGPRDIGIAISYNGTTEEITALLPFFEQKNVPLIALTGNLSSPLAKKAAFAINCSVTEEACAHNLAPTSSTTVTLAIGDALAISLMKMRGFSRDDFAKNHPSGALGRRLQLRVRDLMHPVPDVPVCSASATMDEVLEASTERKLGGVLVCDKLKLIGIITDGDIRRALKNRAQFFSMTAEEIMTAKPSVTQPDVLAYDALRMMEERESQISVLPVIDEAGRAIGLVRIHDLVQTF